MKTVLIAISYTIKIMSVQTQSFGIPASMKFILVARTCFLEGSECECRRSTLTLRGNFFVAVFCSVLRS